LLCVNRETLPVFKTVRSRNNKGDLIIKLLLVAQIQGFTEDSGYDQPFAYFKFAQSGIEIGGHAVLFDGNKQVADYELHRHAPFFLLITNHLQPFLKRNTVGARPCGRNKGYLLLKPSLIARRGGCPKEIPLGCSYEIKHLRQQDAMKQWLAEFRW
jgi:hypothetical protein